MGLEREGLFLTFFPWKGGGGAYKRRRFILGGGLNSGLTVAYDIRSRRHGTKFLQRRFYGQLSLTDRYFCSAGSRLLDKEGARSSGPWDGGGGVSLQKFFRHPGPQFGKNKGGGPGPSPWSATAFGSGIWRRSKVLSASYQVSDTKLNRGSKERQGPLAQGVRLIRGIR